MSSSAIESSELIDHIGHIGHFQVVTQNALEVMFDCRAEILPVGSGATEDDYFTDMPFSARIQFTGVSDSHLVSGEYILACDERVAAAACGILDASASSAEVEAVRAEVSDGFSELLNSVVGEAVLALEGLGRLKFSTPRLSYGKMSYGCLEIRKGTLEFSAGRIECHFHCDRVSLD